MTTWGETGNADHCFRCFLDDWRRTETDDPCELTWPQIESAWIKWEALRASNGLPPFGSPPLCHGCVSSLRQYIEQSREGRS